MSEVETFMLELSSLKFFANENKRFIFWIEFVRLNLPSANYLFCVIYKLLNRKGCKNSEKKRRSDIGVVPCKKLPLISLY